MQKKYYYYLMRTCNTYGMYNTSALGRGARQTRWEAGEIYLILIVLTTNRIRDAQA